MNKPKPSSKLTFDPFLNLVRPIPADAEVRAVEAAIFPTVCSIGTADAIPTLLAMVGTLLWVDGATADGERFEIAMGLVRKGVQHGIAQAEKKALAAKGGKPAKKARPPKVVSAGMHAGVLQ